MLNNAIYDQPNKPRYLHLWFGSFLLEIKGKTQTVMYVQQ